MSKAAGDLSSMDAGPMKQRVNRLWKSYSHRRKWSSPAVRVSFTDRSIDENRSAASCTFTQSNCIAAWGSVPERASHTQEKAFRSMIPGSTVAQMDTDAGPSASRLPSILMNRPIRPGDLLASDEVLPQASIDASESSPSPPVPVASHSRSISSSGMEHQMVQHMASHPVSGAFTHIALQMCITIHNQTLTSLGWWG
jgi:hypothetical protein